MNSCHQSLDAAQTTLNRINKRKSITEHIIVKLQKAKGKWKASNVDGQEDQITLK